MACLQNKTALITGGTSGIGLVTARQFIAEGARVAVTGTSPSGIAGAPRQPRRQGRVIQADARNADGQKAVANATREAFGHFDILFVNAGANRVRPDGAVERGSLRQIGSGQCQGSVLPDPGAAAGLLHPASILLKTSINPHIGMPSSSVYALTKAALFRSPRPFRANASAAASVSTQ